MTASNDKHRHVVASFYRQRPGVAEKMRKYVQRAKQAKNAKSAKNANRHELLPQTLEALASAADASPAIECLLDSL